MIRLLFYIGFISFGAMVAPSLLEHKGYALITFGSYSIETTALALGIFILLFIGLIYAGFKVIAKVKNLLIEGQNIPRQWRKRHAQETTIKGVFALFEHKWSDAEKFLSSPSQQKELATINYLAAAHAAHQQNKFKNRDKYLKQAGSQHNVSGDIRTTQIKYLLEEDAKRARKEVDKLNISAQSSALELKLAWLTYKAQNDYLALHPLLDAMKKHKIIDKETHQEYRHKAIALEFQQATSLKELEAMWQTLGIFESRNPFLQAKYAQQLNQFNPKKAKEFLLPELKKLDTNILDIAVEIFDWEKDNKAKATFNRLQKNKPKHVALNKCIARLCIQSRLFKKAKEALTPATKASPDKENLIMLAEVCEQLGDPIAAIKSYKQAARLQ